MSYNKQGVPLNMRVTRKLEDRLWTKKWYTAFFCQHTKSTCIFLELRHYHNLLLSWRFENFNLSVYCFKYYRRFYEYVSNLNLLNKTKIKRNSPVILKARKSQTTWMCDQGFFSLFENFTCNVSLMYDAENYYKD